MSYFPQVEVTDGTNVLGVTAHPVKTDPTGTTTQPVSGSVTVSNFPATQPVSGTVTANAGTGTFGTQDAADVTPATTTAPGKVLVVAGKTSDVTPAYDPIPLTAAGAAVKTDGSATTQPVSGTVGVNNFPATQPVSAAALPLPSGAATAAKQPALGVAGTPSADVISVQGVASMTALKVDGSAVTQPVSGTVTGNQGTPNTAANAWPHKVTDGTNTAAVKAASTAAAATDPALVVAVSPNNSVAVTQATPASLQATVTPIAITKGTQGATGFTVQELKDAGRNNTTFFTLLPIVTTASEALLSLTGFKADVVVTATTTPAVITAGKKYRVTGINVTYVAIATAGSVRMSLRKHVGATVAVTDPVLWQTIVGGPAVVAGVAQTVSFDVDMEINGGDGIGVSQIGLGATQTATAVGFGAITIYGYEY